MKYSEPDVAAAFDVCEEIVEGVLSQTEDGADHETLDTAALAHLMASVQLMSMRGVPGCGIHTLLDGLLSMLQDEDAPEAGD